jgi:hypothetical protein
MQADSRQAAPISQEDRELQEALRVQAMTDEQRSTWMRTVWDRVQRNAQALRVHAPEHQPTARCYASMEEKNRFDDARELEFALRYSVIASQRKRS